MRHITKILIIALAFGLTACDKTPNTGKDGYKFETKQIDRDIVTVEIVKYPTEKAIQAAYADRGGKLKDVIAFSVLRKPDYELCTMHILDPTMKYVPELIGHEFLHCVYGEWHKP